ncbi:MAG: hypothetical protein ACYCVN_15075 [Acidimicrobiales bacterium]
MPESTDIYTSAVQDLASAIAEVWRVCEDGYDRDRGLGAGGNLAEALSYALGLAAVALGLDRDANGTLVDGERAQMMAAEALVRHRPGAWEAEHVLALTFPPDLIDHTELSDHTERP